ncbi:MAG: hypothetical protein IPN78_19215 [Candidatus Accumulibacter sp.]|nr:hypothetical protein [Candidatus Accumulibacter propinquus]
MAQQKAGKNHYILNQHVIFQADPKTPYYDIGVLNFGFRRAPSHEQPTADDAFDQQQVFRVTHPFHPLFGREFVLIERRNAWGEERVHFHDDSGRVRRLTAAWTSAVAPDPFASVSAGRSHFRSTTSCTWWR